MYGNSVMWADCGHVVTDTENGKRFIARLVSFEGVTVIAGKAASPVVLIGGEYCGLEGEPVLEWLNSVGDSRNQGQRTILCGGHGHY